MSSEILASLVEANLALAAAVLLVLALRRAVRAVFGARIAYALWLIAPLAIIALLIPARTIVLPAPAPEAAVSQVVVLPVPASESVQTGGVDDKPAASAFPIVEIALALWLLVALAAVVIQIERQRRFVRSLGLLRNTGEERLMRSDRPCVGPAVIGALAPRVVLPADFDRQYTTEEQVLILAHERNHLAVGDAQINAAVTALQCLFWFNPFVHLGAATLRIDQEIACDAAVLARHPKTRRAYGEAMLKTQLAACAPPLGCHWPASANKQLKERFTMLTHHRADRRRHLAGAAAVALLGLSTAAVAWAAQPARTVQQTPEEARRAVARHLGRPLYDAVDRKDSQAVGELIALGANPNYIARGDGSPLIEAARSGQIEIVRALLAAGADPNMAVRGDGNPLIQASLAGRLDIVRALVERGADVESFVPGDETPLIGAARRGDLAVVKYLVERGADVNRAVVANPGEMRSPLGMARKNGHSAVVSYLKSRGARD